MTIKKETELMHAIIIYCLRCQDEGDMHALHEMGFGPREIQVLSTLSSSDQIRLASTRAHFMNIVLNQEIYWRMIDFINRENERDAIVNQLIQNHAPLPLMHSLTGMSNKQYTLKRRQFGMLASQAGRPPSPSEETTNLVWEKLKSITSQSDSFGPKQFMQLYEDLEKKVSLRVIWNLFSHWESDGALKVSRGPNPNV